MDTKTPTGLQNAAFFIGGELLCPWRSKAEDYAWNASIISMSTMKTRQRTEMVP